MCHWNWYLNFCSSSWKLWWQYIYMGGIDYHITTNLAIMIVSLMSLYMWYTKEDTLWMKTCMALRKYRMETRHWGACSVLYAVPSAGDSVLNLISACQSDDWEGIYCCIRDIIKYLLRIIKEILSVSPCQGPRMIWYFMYLQVSCCGGTQRSWDRIGRVTFTWRADSTLIHHQVTCMCWKRLPQHICVWLPDTYVLILLLELVFWGHLGDC